MTDEELLASIAEHAGEDKAKQRQFALKLLENEATKEIGEVLLKKGLSKRTADVTGQATELATHLKEAKDELAEARNQIKELEAKEPNWDRRLKDEAAKWQKKVDDAEAKALNERRTGLQDRVETERQKFIAALRIGQDDGVEEGYGKLLPAQYDRHFVPDDEKRAVKVLELGEKDSFYDPSEGDPAEQLARDVLAKVPPKYRLAGTPEGGGGTGNGSGPVNKAVQQIVDTKARTGAYQL